MELNLEKCAEHGANLRNIVNTKIDEGLNKIASILKSLEGNEKQEECFEALGKMENGYNEVYYPKFQEEEKVLLEEMPELAAKINSITVDAVKVSDVDAKIAKIDTDQVGVL